MRKNLLTLEQLGPGDCYPKSASLPPRDENIPARFALHRSLLLYLPVTKVQRHDVDLYLRSIDPSSVGFPETCYLSIIVAHEHTDVLCTHLQPAASFDHQLWSAAICIRADEDGCVARMHAWIGRAARVVEIARLWSAHGMRIAGARGLAMTELQGLTSSPAGRWVPFPCSSLFFSFSDHTVGRPRSSVLLYARCLPRRNEAFASDDDWRTMPPRTTTSSIRIDRRRECDQNHIRSVSQCKWHGGRLIYAWSSCNWTLYKQ